MTSAEAEASPFFWMNPAVIVTGPDPSSYYLYSTSYDVIIRICFKDSKFKSANHSHEAPIQYGIFLPPGVQHIELEVYFFKTAAIIFAPRQKFKCTHYLV